MNAPIDPNPAAASTTPAVPGQTATEAHDANPHRAANHSNHRDNSDTKFVPLEKLAIGGGALILWLLLFSAGLLFDTSEARLTLAPDAIAKQLAAANPNLDVATIKARVANNSKFWAFVTCVTCYTPINLALLTIAAGLAGGCASNISYNTMKEAVKKELSQTRAQYLEEPPASATIRGFVVYLCVIAGLYIVSDDPFKDPTASQYIRLAGMLSVLGFIVGYDPSRLVDWLNIVPTPARLAGGKIAQAGTDSTAEPDHITTIVKHEVREEKQVLKQEQSFKESPLPESHEEADQQAQQKEQELATPPAAPQLANGNGTPKISKVKAKIGKLK